MALYKTLHSLLDKVGFHNESTEAQAHRLSEDIDGIVLEARTIVQSLMAGPYGQRHHGAGDDFWQYKPYEHGDPIRMIDWKKTAQTGTPFILQKEKQTIQKVAILSPHTQAMDFTGPASLTAPSGQSKYSAALVLSLCLMLIFRQSHHPFASITGAQNGASGTKFGTSEHHMMQELHRLASPDNTLDSEDDRESFARFLEHIPPHTHLFWIGDFWSSTAFYKDVALDLKDRDCFIYPIQITTEAEHNLPYSGHIEYQDMQSENVHDITESNAIRDEYKKRIQHHILSLHSIFLAFESPFFTHKMSEPLKPFLDRIMREISVQSSNVRI